MFETLLSLLGGGIMRVIPELVGLWNKKTDYAHEVQMLDKQLELERYKSDSHRADVELQGSIEKALKMLEAQKDALAGQMKLTGLWFVDALNMLVRPLTTYYFLALYGLAKTAMFAQALQTADVWTAILKVYTPDDVSMFFGILSFWFVGRVFDKK